MEHAPVCGCLEHNLLPDDKAVMETTSCSHSLASQLKGECVCSCDVDGYVWENPWDVN